MSDETVSEEETVSDEIVSEDEAAPREMGVVYDCSDPDRLLEGRRMACEAIERGELIVVPTDTVYGIAANAFDADAVARLRAAKGSGRQSPPAVLVPEAVSISSLAIRVPGAVHQLTPRFWPGGLTIVLQSPPSLNWDLGDTENTVSLRMPDSPLLIELMKETGPLAVSAANTAGAPVATTAAEAKELFGDAVAVYLDGGPIGAADADAEDAGDAGDAGDADGEASDRRTALPSTILDATIAIESGKYRILRHGAVTAEQLRIVLGDDVVIDPAEVEAQTEDAEDAAEDAPEQPPEQITVHSQGLESDASPRAATD